MPLILFLGKCLSLKIEYMLFIVRDHAFYIFQILTNTELCV